MPWIVPDDAISQTQLAQRWRLSIPTARIRWREAGLHAIQLPCGHVFFDPADVAQCEDEPEQQEPDS